MSDSWEDRHYRAMAKTRLAEQAARMLLRLVGPRVSAVQDEKIALKYCSQCEPDPLLYGCPICGFTSETKWQFSVHLMVNPETCQRTADRKARRWASRT